MTALTAARTPTEAEVKRYYAEQKIEVEFIKVENPTDDQVELSDILKSIMEIQKEGK